MAISVYKNVCQPIYTVTTHAPFCALFLHKGNDIMDIHPIEPYFNNLIENSTDQRLSDVILWCTRPYSGVPHWITSFTYANGAAHGFGGFSLDMFKPHRHEAAPDADADTPNFEGSLKATERTAKRLVSSSPGRLQKIRFTEVVTTADVLGLIQERKLQYYRFNTECCSGCMCWQLTLLDTFVEKGWIPSAEVQSARDVFRPSPRSIRGFRTLLLPAPS
ncbi:hypothetical protein K525DRAFT_271583 [Schizophyllum commune Loenen D]|nr:hypothetical protein K525DRAFT_271583 [Schizophyllum commune Loenen D]